MQLFLPHSATHYNHLWPISEKNGPGMALLYDIAISLAPQLSVCLHNSCSDAFATVCQAVTQCQPDGLVYDAQPLTETKSNQLKRFIRNNFPAVGYVTEQHPTSALNHFSDNSVDLVFIDGLALKKDDINQEIEYWTKKINTNGIIAIRANQNIDNKTIETALKLNTSEQTITLLSKKNLPKINHLKTLFEEQDIEIFYSSIGKHWSNLTKIDQSKKNQLVKQIEKRLIEKNEKDKN